MMLNYFEWMTLDELLTPEYFFVTYNLFQIENKIRVAMGEEMFSSVMPCLHMPRRFEYPWVYLRIPRSSKKILDAGGGDSTFQFYLSLFFDDVYNVDSDKNFIERTELVKKETGEFKNLYTSEQQLISTDFSDNFFDCSVCVSVIEHIRRKHGTSYEIIRELQRVTRGPVVLTFDVILDDVAGVLKGKESEKIGIGMAELYLLAEKLDFVVPENPLYNAFIDPETKNTFTIAGLYLGGD